MNCDMCGKEAELYLVEVEGTKLNVCSKCSKFGTVIKKIVIKKPKKEKEKKVKIIKLPKKEVIQIIVPGYAEIIKKKRERLGLKQKDFAKMISEKESLLRKTEKGIMEPSIALARKLEKFLKIKLVEEHEEVRGEKKEVKGEELTIGDLAKVKKR